jgi:hypothetical protein
MKTKQNKTKFRETKGCFVFFTPVVVSFVQPVSSDTQKIETTRKQQNKTFPPHYALVSSRLSFLCPLLMCCSSLLSSINWSSCNESTHLFFFSSLFPLAHRSAMLFFCLYQSLYLNLNTHRHTQTCLFRFGGAVMMMMMMGGFEYYISPFLSVCVPSCARVPYRLSLLIDPTPSDTQT